MKRAITLLLIIVSILTCFSCCAAASSPYIPTDELDITEFVDQTTDNAILKHRQELAHTMAECARALGYGEDNGIIKTAQEEWWKAYCAIIENNKVASVWSDRFDEFPYATYIWLYFTKGLGYSEAVVAGMIGNMMAEVGGGTLDIQYWLYSYGSGYYYGICQWNKKNFPDVRGKDLIGQCEYLAQTIEEQMNAFGKAYKINDAYHEFLQLDSCRDAALMFAKLYEACSSDTYKLRQNYAEVAYKYFMGL